MSDHLKTIHESETATQIRELTRKFAQTELAPHIEQDEHDEKFRPELVKRLGELGLTGVPINEDYGGAGLGYQEYIAVIEELAAVNAGYAISVAVTGLAQIAIQTFGTEAQKKKYTPKLSAGLGIGAFGL